MPTFLADAHTHRQPQDHTPPQGEYVVFPGVAVFAEHEGTVKDAQGKPIKAKFDRASLQAIAQCSNRRSQLTGDHAAVIVGHTPAPQYVQMGIAQSPPVIGYALNFRVGDQAGRSVILADFHIRRDKLEDWRSHPRRSVEFFYDPDHQSIFLDPIALLGGEVPRLDLGLAAYCRPSLGRTQYRLDLSPSRFGVEDLSTTWNRQTDPLPAQALVQPATVPPVIQPPPLPAHGPRSSGPQPSATTAPSRPAVRPPAIPRSKPPAIPAGGPIPAPPGSPAPAKRATLAKPISFPPNIPHPGEVLEAAVMLPGKVSHKVLGMVRSFLRSRRNQNQASIAGAFSFPPSFGTPARRRNQHAAGQPMPAPFKPAAPLSGHLPGSGVQAHSAGEHFPYVPVIHQAGAHEGHYYYIHPSGWSSSRVPFRWGSHDDMARAGRLAEAEVNAHKSSGSPGNQAGDPSATDTSYSAGNDYGGLSDLPANPKSALGQLIQKFRPGGMAAAPKGPKDPIPPAMNLPKPKPTNKNAAGNSYGGLGDLPANPKSALGQLIQPFKPGGNAAAPKGPKDPIPVSMRLPKPAKNQNAAITPSDLLQRLRRRKVTDTTSTVASQQGVPAAHYAVPGDPPVDPTQDPNAAGGADPGAAGIDPETLNALADALFPLLLERLEAMANGGGEGDPAGPPPGPAPTMASANNWQAVSTPTPDNRGGNANAYARELSELSARVQHLLAVADQQSMELQHERALRVNVERRETLSALRSQFAFDLEDMLVRTQYARMPEDTSFADTVDFIRRNCTANPVGMSLPAAAEPRTMHRSPTPSSGANQNSASLAKEAIKMATDSIANGKQMSFEEARAILANRSNGKQPARV